MKLVATLAALALCAGCITVRLPDGTETTSVDTEAIARSIMLAEQGLALAEQAYSLYQQYEAGDSNEDAPADLDRLQTRVDYWTAVLERLYTAYADATTPAPAPAPEAETPTVSAAP